MPRYWTIFLISAALLSILVSLYEISSPRVDVSIEYNSGKEFREAAGIPSEEASYLEKMPRGRIVLGKKVNLNSAGVDELAALPGISLDVARNIAIIRKKMGKFSKVEDLLKVKGIKKKKLEMIKPYVELR